MTPLATDQRRITEHDADYQRVHTRTVEHLTRSLDELSHDLRRGDPMAQSSFIQRHTDILYLAYLAAHREGQRDYWQTVSLRAAPTRNPDQAQTRRRLQFFLTSVAKMAMEALQALQKPKTLDEGDLNDWEQKLPIRIGLQADLTWSAFNDGYIDAGNLDNARPYLRVWWDLEPTARHCYDCPEYAKGSPYTAPGTGMYGGNELDATPGDGHTACGAACKCSLSYGPGIDTEVTDWGSVFPVDAPLDEIWPEELPSLTLGMPGNDALTTMQKAALDDFRDAWDAWDQVRDGNPELPEMFDANFQKNSGINTLWERLTELQQQALFKVMEALKAWQDAGGGMQMAEMGQGYLLYSPDQARVPKGAPEPTEETKTDEQSQPQQHGNKRPQARARRRTPGQADTANPAEDA